MSVSSAWWRSPAGLSEWRSCGQWDLQLGPPLPACGGVSTLSFFRASSPPEALRESTPSKLPASPSFLDLDPSEKQGILRA